MGFPTQISILNMFILLITCNADSTIQNSNFSFDHASIKRLVKPLSYDLTIDLTLEDFLVFHGVSTNLIIIENPTRKIDLKVDGLTIRKKRLCLSRYPYMDCYKFQHNSEATGTLRLEFDNDVPLGFYSMTIEFSRDILEDEIKVYRTSCEDCNEKTRLIFTTQLEQFGTQQICPYWDGDASRARFGLAIKHDQNYKALSNMPIQSHWKVTTKQTQFYSTPPIPTHLVTLSLTNFVCFTKEERFTTRVCATSLVETQTTFALKTSAAVMSYMMQYTGISPKFPEITIISLPDSFFRSADVWRFNVYREDHLIYNESLHSVDRKLDVSMIVASQTAFQWFNHLFSTVLWTHVWFCQTLALFYGAKAFAKEYNDKDISSLFTYRLRSLAREDNVISLVKPILFNDYSKDVDKLNISAKRDIFLSSHFSNCLKEYAVMVMLENAVTEPVFRMATILYLKKHQFSTATPNDFWDVIQDIVDKREAFHNFPPIAQVVHDWLIQRSLPVVTVTSISGDVIEHGSYVIKHENMYTENDNNTNDLLLPINYVVRSSPKHISNIVWLARQEQVNVSMINIFHWIIINWQHAGYYRVKYDYRSLDNLAIYLNSNSTYIDVLSRAHIIADAYYFLEKKELENSMFEKLLYFMFGEKECAPWYAMQNIIQKMWIFLNTDAGKYTYHFIRHIFKTLIQKMGYTEYPNDTDGIKFKRLLAAKWACRFNDKECLDIAKKRLNEHLKEPERHIILPTWEEWTYCNGLKFSNKLIWNEILVKFRKTGNKKILMYLICSEDDIIIRNYFDLVMSMEPSVLDLLKVDVEDRRKIYRSIFHNHIRKNNLIEHIFKKILETEIIGINFVVEVYYIIENVYSVSQMNMIYSLLLDALDAGLYNRRLYDNFMIALQNQYDRIKRLEQLAK